MPRRSSRCAVIVGTLNRCMSRSNSSWERKTVNCKLKLVFVVNSLLKSLDLSQPIGDLSMAEFQNVSPTFGQRCRRILLEVFHDLIQTIAQWLKENQMTPSQVFELLFNRLLYV